MQSADKNNLMVIVQMVTYNHGRYIEQAINSVMSQKTTFPYKLLICEDFSTDNTREICIMMKTKYPEKIELVLNEKNLGVKYNARQIHKMCFESGARYISILEGDDYWSDKRKLQIQVEFLENNEDYNICFHKVYELVGRKEKKIPSTLNTSDQEQTFTILELAKGNFIHTPSVIYRNGLIKKMPNWFEQVSAGDYVIQMLNAKQGKIKYFPKPMAVYRRHAGGYWSAKKDQKQTWAWLEVLDLLITENFSDEVIANLKKQKDNVLANYFYSLLDKGDYEMFRAELALYATKYSEINNKWIEEFFLGYIRWFKNSRSFKLSKRLSFIKKRLDQIF